MRAKICGITNLDDAHLAVTQKAWALGFNFYPKSPRFIDKTLAKKLIKQLPDSILKVGVLINIDGVDVDELFTFIDLLQVYEDVNVNPSLKSRMILSLTSDGPNARILDKYGYLLLDAPKLAGEYLGGTGRLSDWYFAKELAKHHRLILAGGLTPNNVQLAIQTVNPYAVDVASGVQLTPGRLSSELLTKFLNEVNYGA